MRVCACAFVGVVLVLGVLTRLEPRSSLWRRDALVDILLVQLASAKWCLFQTQKVEFSSDCM